MSRFKKGQQIYRASSWGIPHKDCNITGFPKHFVYVALSKVVDACGKKKVTFYDKEIHTFCRSCNANYPDLFATHEEALAKLEVMIVEKKKSNELQENKDPSRFAGMTSSTFQIVKTVYADNESGYVQLRKDLASLEHFNSVIGRAILRPSFYVKY
jgi:ferredoxin